MPLGVTLLDAIVGIKIGVDVVTGVTT